MANFNPQKINVLSWFTFQDRPDPVKPGSIEESILSFPLEAANPQKTWEKELDRVRLALFVVNPDKSTFMSIMGFLRLCAVWWISIMQLSIYLILQLMASALDEMPVMLWIFYQNLAPVSFREAGWCWREGQLARDIRKELLVALICPDDLEKWQSKEDAKKLSREIFEEFIQEVLKIKGDTSFLIKNSSAYEGN